MGPVNSRMPMIPQQQQTQPQLQQSSPQHQQQPQHQPSPMSHPHHSPMNVNHHSPMNPQMMGGGPNSFVPSPMNQSAAGPQVRSGTPASSGGPKRTSTPSEDFNLDFLDSPASGNSTVNGPLGGNNNSNGSQSRGGSHSRGNDELIHLFNNQ